MENILYEKCSFKYEVKAVLVSIFLASSGNSLYIFPAAKAKDFWPNFSFRSGSAKLLLLLGCYCGFNVRFRTLGECPLEGHLS